MNKKDKRGVSAVLATALIILFIIVSIIIVWTFVRSRLKTGVSGIEKAKCIKADFSIKKAIYEDNGDDTYNLSVAVEKGILGSANLKKIRFIINEEKEIEMNASGDLNFILTNIEESEIGNKPPVKVEISSVLEVEGKEIECGKCAESGIKGDVCIPKTCDQLKSELGKECGTGWSNNCGGTIDCVCSAGTCDASGRCVVSCTPDCTGKECGDDGCGGSCPPGCNDPDKPICDDGVCKESDTTAPTVTINSPTNGQTLSQGTTSIILNVSTNENALCKYHTSDVGYSAMPPSQNFGVTAPTQSFSASISVSTGTNNYYVSCSDGTNENDNTNNAEVSFTVSSGPTDTTAPTVYDLYPSSPGPYLPTELTRFSVRTNEVANCRLSVTTPEVSEGDLPYENMHQFSTTDSTYHSHPITGALKNGEYFIYVKCKDTSGNINSPSAVIRFTISLPTDYVWQSCDTSGIYGYFGTNYNWQSDYFLGYKFKPTKDGQISEVCGYFNGERRVKIQDSSFSVLREATVTSSNSWSCVSITPLDVEENKEYYVGVALLAGTSDGSYHDFQGTVFFPKTCNDVRIILSCTQHSVDQFTGTPTCYSVIMYGMVDIKFT